MVQCIYSFITSKLHHKILAEPTTLQNRVFLSRLGLALCLSCYEMLNMFKNVVSHTVEKIRLQPKLTSPNVSFVDVPTLQLAEYKMEEGS